jgi:hypothetical protein
MSVSVIRNRLSAKTLSKDIITGTAGWLRSDLCLAIEVLAFFLAGMPVRKKTVIPRVYILPTFVQIYTFCLIQIVRACIVSLV